ncbi:MAG: hypothetical protein Q8O55_09465 [Dehalococcoidales bacterium]|nr:hypothetical protein [Dehalococcoidales bacterium]
MSDMESAFYNAMLSIYVKAKEECHYNATYFLRMVTEMGGVAAAKRLLSSNVPQSGLFELWECGRLDISMEALVLNHKFRSLFCEEELKAAEQRLKDLGYKFS